MKIPMPRFDRRQMAAEDSRTIVPVVDEHGGVACNPRDREAAHRAETEGIATSDLRAVTCRKCLIAARRLRGGPRDGSS